MAEYTAEVKALNAVLKSEDKNLLFAPFVDDLFTSYGDVWEFAKEYNVKYGVMPPFDLVRDRFGDDLPDIDVPGKAKHHVDALKSEYVSNRLDSILIGASKAKSGGMTSEEVKANLQQKLNELDRFSDSARDLQVMDIESAKTRYDEMRERAQAMGGTPGVPTGIEFIDANVPLGMQGGDIFSIIGYPARGKSALGTLIAANAIRNGFTPLIFSREMTAEAVQDRIFTVLGSGLFSNQSLMIGDVNPDQLRDFAAKNKGSAWVVDGNTSANMTPNFIRTKINEHQPDVVIIDYLQLFNDNRMTSDMTARMRNLSLELKLLSNEVGVPFVVISSATPPDGNKVSGPPSVENSAWSRQIAYDSTICMAIHRHDGSSLFQIEGAKNRYGDIWSGFLDWDIDRGIYEEKMSLE